MSWQPASDPKCDEQQQINPIEMVIVPRARDLGGFEVRRALPSARRQMVGPFIFFDQMGPAEFLLGQGIDVRPHPHIGLATVTYLIRGEIIHRDSLGTLQPIRPGAVNWMTAGRGIAHSERTAPEARTAGAELFGIQTWVALPAHAEETAPGFSHHEEAELPLIADQGTSVRLIVGSLYGRRSPVWTFSEMFYADAALEAGARLPLDASHEERGIYIVEGSGRDRGRRVRGDAAPGVPAGRSDHRDGARAHPAHAAGRRADGRAAPHLVELRLQLEGADRAGQGRLAGRALHARARGCRVHPAAGVRRRSSVREAPP